MAEGILRNKNPCCSFTTVLTRLLPCTGASRTASWLFETWFGAAGGGRDGHSAVHSREGREGNVTGFTTAPGAAPCAHAGSVGVKQRRGEKYGKRGNRVTDRGNTMNGTSKNQFWSISISRSTDASAGTSYLTLKLGMWFASTWHENEIYSLCHSWHLNGRTNPNTTVPSLQLGSTWRKKIKK